MARDEPGRDFRRPAPKPPKSKPSKKPPKRTNRPSVFDEILSSPLPGTTFAPATVPKKTPKPTAKKPPPRPDGRPGFDFLKSATELRSYQDLVAEGRRKFMADVPFTKKISRDPGPSLAQWMATHKGDPTALNTYVQLRRQRDFTEAENAKWRKERAKEWEDVLSGKAEREQKAAFHTQFGAEEIDPMPKALWERQPWRKETDSSYNAYRERLKKAKRTKVEGMYQAMLEDPEGWYEREGRKSQDIVGDISHAGIGGLEWFGLPKSVGNDLRLISSGFIPGIVESGKAVFAAAKGDPTKIAAIINDTIEQYRTNYLDPKGGNYARKHPVLFGLDAAIVLGPIAKLSSVLMLSRSLRMANPGMTVYQANRIATKESSRPGYAATKGFEGGIKQRHIVGKTHTTERPRPQSRSPIGRAGQKGYDRLSAQLEKGIFEPVGKMPVFKQFTPSSRAASMDAKARRRDQQRMQGLITALQDPVADYTTKGGKARLGKLVGRAIPDKKRAALLIAALEAGTDVNVAVPERIAALKNVLDQGIMFDRSPIESDARVKFEATLSERFEPDQVQQILTLSDSMARAKNPRNPASWYDKHLADSSNMDVEDFMKSGASAAAQYQITAGFRGGLLEEAPGGNRWIPHELLNDAFDHMHAARQRGEDRPWQIFFETAEGKGSLIATADGNYEMYQYDHPSNDVTPMTEEQAYQFLSENVGDNDLFFGNAGHQMGEHEMPVFYSPLQRAIEELPGRQMKGMSLRKALKKLGVTDNEWEWMGMDAFFDEAAIVLDEDGYYVMESTKDGQIEHKRDYYQPVPYEKLLDYLQSPLNAYNLSEIVRSFDLSHFDPAYEPLYENYAGGGLIARSPSVREPYYELTMSLGALHPRQSPLVSPFGAYTGKAAGHWSTDHFEGDNILVHIRFHITEDVDGKRALLIDEIQSDWASEWREGGSRPFSSSFAKTERYYWLEDEIAKHNQATHDLHFIKEKDEFTNAEADYIRANSKVEDWPGGDPAEIKQLEILRDGYHRRMVLKRDIYYGLRDNPKNVAARQEANERFQELRKEQIALRRELENIPPPLGGKEMNAAVRRMTRWAAEADVDRIIITSGEMQALRNSAYGKTPVTGTRVDFHGEHGQESLESRTAMETWMKEIQTMGPEQIREWARKTARGTGASETYFRIYEKDIPNMFESTLGVEGRFKDEAYWGRYSDEMGAIGIPVDPTKEVSGVTHFSNSAQPGYVIDLTPDAKEDAMYPQRLFQRQPDWKGTPRGATELLADGNLAMRLFQGADVDTVIHELAHIAFYDMDPETQRLIESAFGGPIARWTEQQHEAFARGFEHYLYSGKAPTPELQKAFTKIQAWIAQIWHAMKQDPQKYAMTPEMDEAYERMVLPKDRSPLDAEERNYVETQIKELEEALLDQGDLDKQHAALTALRRMSALVEDYGREIMLFGLDDTPDEGAAQWKDNPDTEYMPGPGDDVRVPDGRVGWIEHRWATDDHRVMSTVVLEDGSRVQELEHQLTHVLPSAPVSPLAEQQQLITEMFQRRRGAYTELLKTMGIIDPDDATTRAGGYFPNLSVWRTGGHVPLDPTKLAATGNVMGVPQARPDAINMDRNQFIRFQTGELGMNPAVLFDVMRMRVKHLATLQIRQRLYDQGTDTVKGKAIEDYDKNLIFIRNPVEQAEKIPLQVKAALAMDEDSYMALVARGEDPSGQLDSADEASTASQDWDANTWWPQKKDANGAKVPKPYWLKDVDTVRTIPRHIAEKLVGEVFPTAPRGGVIAPTANALARITMLYAPGFIVPGSRYAIRNFLQNAVLAGLTNPASLRYAYAALKTLEEERHHQIRNEIDAEAGSTRAEAALPEYYTQAQTPGQHFERGVTEFQKNIGSALSRIADDPFRRSMWIGYAERYGFHGPEGWARLLHSEDAAIVRTRDLISQAVRDDLIDFDAMSARERAFASHYFFLYPFIRGSLKWPFMFMREYPFRAGLIGAFAGMEGMQREDELLAKTTSEAGRTKPKPGEKQYDYGWLDPFSPAAQTFESVVATAKGLSKMDLSAMAQMLSPEYRTAIQALSGTASRSRPWGSVLSSFIPGFSTYEKWKRGGSASDQFLRHMGVSVEASPSRFIQRKEANAELMDAWTWAMKLGTQGLDVNAISQSAKAYEKYQDLEQRVEFSWKDVGEGSLRADDLSPQQALEREQQLAVALTLAVADAYPETRGQMESEIANIRSADLATLKRYTEAIRARAFGPRNTLVNAYRRSQGKE